MKGIEPLKNLGSSNKKNMFDGPQQLQQRLT